jgi:methionine-rich copper-binding protein CopC
MRANVCKLVAVFVVGLTLVFCSTTALAHARPTVMNPAPDSTVAAPSKISVTFSEALVAQFSSLKLVDGKGQQVGHEKSKGDPSDPKVMTLTVPASLPAGSYRVHWVAAAVDGHRMEGEYKFTVK